MYYFNFWVVILFICLIVCFCSVPKGKTISHTSKPFYNGAHGERNFNDSHPVLAVLTFITLFGSGVGSFQIVKTMYESIIMPTGKFEVGGYGNGSEHEGTLSVEWNDEGASFDDFINHDDKDSQ